ncbi:beta-ketoacyl-[acyl-carrier-protein] synthase family protein [Leucobacter sp. CSA1]|uniref:Beta-ketoacyl-[acyl-carrier-protein] synthase family protein n=2 Tax=Leucobacter chromiisoli TaxID=2796471 RepID=A0A934Q8V5_9MICO|nr:beta-ketoacyl-[acyl-carrier-protein] synthase family protein [Leucobacter chromiisoli]
MGAITPSGIGARALWESVSAGRSAITALEGAEFDGLPVRIGGQVRGFDVATVLEPGLARRLSPVQHWALAAADEALAQASAAPESGALPWDGARVAVIAATGSGPVDAMQRATRALDGRGARAVPLTLAVYGAPDAAAALLSQRYGALGPAQGVSATCASGAIGLGEGLRRIRHGYADAVVVVGMEDCLNPVNLASNANMRALAAGYEDDPASASRPFDRARSGFVMSQGAAAILLESEESARARGAEALAELAGFGASSDAHHPTAPHPQGRGAARAVRDCLADAGAEPGEVDHVNAHGTGTPAGDAAELAALEAALGDAARGIPISATKSSTGHLLGAGGAVEAIISVMALRTGILPPTLNLDDPEFDGWDFVVGARERGIRSALSTSFGFGGHNAALLLRG